MKPLSIDGAISTLQNLEKAYDTLHYTAHFKLWSDSVEEHYKYLIDRCQLFIGQAFKATTNQERYVFAIRISSTNYLGFAIHDRVTQKEIYSAFQGDDYIQIGLRRNRYQYDERYNSNSCKYLIESFQYLQQHLNQLHKLKKTKDEPKPKKSDTAFSIHFADDGPF